MVISEAKVGIRGPRRETSRVFATKIRVDAASARLGQIHSGTLRTLPRSIPRPAQTQTQGYLDCCSSLAI